jgi:flagellar hook-associated protein 3 FlgL
MTMRLSTNTIYEQNVTSILAQQEGLQKTQQQISTGKRMLTPADDPVAAAQALNISQTDSLNTQYAKNRTNANDSLALSDTILGGISDLVQDVRTTAVYAGNGVLTDNERTILADTLRSRMEELIGKANSTDSAGRYLFSGYQGTTKPFSQTATGVQYAGDQGQRLVQATASRQIAISDSGSDIFERIKNGNGVFATAAGAGNTGSGVVSPGSVVNPASLTGHSYQINFTGTATYDVVDNSTLPAPTTLSTGNAYISGSAINFDGLQFNIEGSPASGDTFTVTPSTNQSLFTTIANLITTLAAPVITPADSTKLSNGVNTALQNLDKGLDHIVTSRAAIGARQQEMDALQSIGEDLGQQYQQSLSQLQDVDYARAISDLDRQQVYLEAAQKAFNKVSGLSLFNYI